MCLYISALFMAAICNRAGHYIFVLWFLLSSFYRFSSPILRRRSEMCCTWLAEIQDAKTAKKSPSGHHRTTLSACIFATNACIDN